MKHIQKTLWSVPLLMFLLTYSGCVPFMMMGDDSSGHAQAKTSQQSTLRVGNLKATAVLPEMEKDKESVVVVTLTDLETGERYTNASVECAVEFGSIEVHQMESLPHEDSKKDSLHTEQHANWKPMEAESQGEFTFAYTPREFGTYQIRIRIASVDNQPLSEPVIIESSRAVTNHLKSQMQHGMMGGMGGFGTIAVVGMVAVMIVLMAARTF